MNNGKKISVIVMTSNSWRHRYFANQMAKVFEVLGVVSETKPVLGKAANIESNPIVSEYDKERFSKEEEYFGAHPEFNLSKDKILTVDWGKSNSPEVFEWAAKLNPDYILLFGTGIIKDPFLSHFSNKVINMHLGLSPYYRGAGTNFWPLVFGEPECVGVTIHLATLKVDAGPILAQVRPEIEPNDTVHDIGFKTVIAGTELMIKCLASYHNGKINTKPQVPGTGKVFRSRDLTPESISKLLDNFNHGMISEYLRNKESRLKEYPIIEL